MAPTYALYVLELGDGSLYVGHTWNVTRRVAQHRARGPMASRICRRVGVRRLRRALCPQDRYCTRAAAVRAEEALAWKLRRQFRNKLVHQH